MRKKSEAIIDSQQFIKEYDDSSYEKPSVTADIVLFGMFDREEENYRKLSEKVLKILLIQRGGEPYKGCYALPGGFVRPYETLADAAARELKEEANIGCDFLEQFGTYSEPGRDPRRWVITNGFMALVDADRYHVCAGDDAAEAKWFEVSLRRFGDNWKLELYSESDKIEAVLKDEASAGDIRRKFVSVSSDDIAFDHEILIADAVMQLRKWIGETHIAFRLLPDKFTLRELQQIYETVLDTKLLVPAFRRKMADLVQETGEMTNDAGHRPAMLYMEK